MPTDVGVECPLPRLSEHILNHVAIRWQSDLTRGEKDKMTHDPQKAAEAVKIIAELKDQVENLKRIEQIGLRWEDKEGRPVYDELDRKIPQAIFLMVELESGAKMVCVVGPDQDKITHGSTFKAHKSGLARQKITTVDPEINQDEFKHYALMASHYLEKPTKHGVDEPFVCPVEGLCPGKYCQIKKV